MRKTLWAALAVAAMSLLGSPAFAQTVTYDGSRNYGVSPCGMGVCDGLASANMHAANGLAAAQAQDAKRGRLTSNQFSQINQSIGTNIVNTLQGDGSSINASQTGTNVGATTNTGQNSMGNRNTLAN